MKQCVYCGQEMLDQAIICPKCNRSVNGKSNRVSISTDGGITLGWISVCSGLYLPIIGWIASGFGISAAKRQQNKQGLILSIIGCAVSTLITALTIVLHFI